MSYVAGSFLFVISFAIIVFARPKGGKIAWVTRIAKVCTSWSFATAAWGRH
jgi:hypothetical protein